VSTRQPRIDELARPQRSLVVREGRLDLDRARGLVDHVVDHAEHAVAEFGLIVAAEGENRQRAGGGRARDSRQVIGRQGEDHRDRLDLRHDDDPGDVRCVDDVTGIDEPYSGTPVERGADRGVVEVTLALS